MPYPTNCRICRIQCGISNEAQRLDGPRHEGQAQQAEHRHEKDSCSRTRPDRNEVHSERALTGLRFRTRTLGVEERDPDDQTQNRQRLYEKKHDDVTHGAARADILRRRRRSSFVFVQEGPAGCQAGRRRSEARHEKTAAALPLLLFQILVLGDERDGEEEKEQDREEEDPLEPARRIIVDVRTRIRSHGCEFLGRENGVD